MRSKEVEDNINLLITYRGNLWQQHKNPKIAKAIDETIDYIEELENKLKQAKEYINEEIYVDYNVTFSCEEDFYNDLPCSLNLHNEDLRKLLDILGE